MSYPGEHDTDIIHGSPVFSGADVPVESLLTYLSQGLSVEEFLEDFPTVSREEALSKLQAIRGD